MTKEIKEAKDSKESKETKEMKETKESIGVLDMFLTTSEFNFVTEASQKPTRKIYKEKEKVELAMSDRKTNNVTPNPATNIATAKANEVLQPKAQSKGLRKEIIHGRSLSLPKLGGRTSSYQKINVNSEVDNETSEKYTSNSKKDAEGKKNALRAKKEMFEPESQKCNEAFDRRSYSRTLAGAILATSKSTEKLHIGLLVDTKRDEIKDELEKSKSRVSNITPTKRNLKTLSRLEKGRLSLLRPEGSPLSLRRRKNKLRKSLLREI